MCWLNLVVVIRCLCVVFFKVMKMMIDDSDVLLLLLFGSGDGRSFHYPLYLGIFLVFKVIVSNWFLMGEELTSVET